MADIKLKYGTSNQLIVIALAGLVDGGIEISNENDNAISLFFDKLIQLQVKTAAAGVSGNGVIRVYAIGSADGGLSYPDSSNYELLPIGIFNANVNATTFISPLMSLANAFNGKIPEKWKLAVKNDTGAALDGTELNHAKFYQGVLAQSV